MTAEIIRCMKSMAGECAAAQMEVQVEDVEAVKRSMTLRGARRSDKIRLDAQSLPYPTQQGGCKTFSGFAAQSLVPRFKAIAPVLTLFTPKLRELDFSLFDAWDWGKSSAPEADRDPIRAVHCVCIASPSCSSPGSQNSWPFCPRNRIWGALWFAWYSLSTLTGL
ncbi:hypothetical protein NMY22_g18343 [Coprinellus aureogranulatus]|nr:hypothetical protein NMY22_g18343 [Coprinellus aureogranulatus]